MEPNLSGPFNSSPLVQQNWKSSAGKADRLSTWAGAMPPEILDQAPMAFPARKHRAFFAVPNVTMAHQTLNTDGVSTSFYKMRPARNFIQDVARAAKDQTSQRPVRDRLAAPSLARRAESSNYAPRPQYRPSPRCDPIAAPCRHYPNRATGKTTSYIAFLHHQHEPLQNH